MNKYFPFVRKASNVIEMSIARDKYVNRLPLYEIEVVQEIKLDLTTYDHFSKNLLEDFNFLNEVSELSYICGNVAKCIKIDCEDNDLKPSIYVVLEGTSYAKYVFSNISID